MSNINIKSWTDIPCHHAEAYPHRLTHPLSLHSRPPNLVCSGLPSVLRNEFRNLPLWESLFEKDLEQLSRGSRWVGKRHLKRCIYHSVKLLRHQLKLQWRSGSEISGFRWLNIITTEALFFSERKGDRYLVAETRWLRCKEKKGLLFKWARIISYSRLNQKTVSPRWLETVEARLWKGNYHVSSFAPPSKLMWQHGQSEKSTLYI